MNRPSCLGQQLSGENGLLARVPRSSTVVVSWSALPYRAQLTRNLVEGVVPKPPRLHTSLDNRRAASPMGRVVKILIDGWSRQGVTVRANGYKVGTSGEVDIGLSR